MRRHNGGFRRRAGKIKGKGNRKSPRWVTLNQIRATISRQTEEEEEETERMSESVTLAGFMVVLLAIRDAGNEGRPRVEESVGRSVKLESFPNLRSSLIPDTILYNR